MRLIDADKLKFPNIAIFDMKLHGATVPMVRLIDLQELIPTVEAVPLDKLCEWLEENAVLTYGAHISAKGWKRELTVWMEAQDENK